MLLHLFVAQLTWVCQVLQAVTAAAFSALQDDNMVASRLDRELYITVISRWPDYFKTLERRPDSLFELVWRIISRVDEAVPTVKALNVSDAIHLVHVVLIVLTVELFGVLGCPCLSSVLKSLLKVLHADRIFNCIEFDDLRGIDIDQDLTIHVIVLD